MSGDRASLGGCRPRRRFRRARSQSGASLVLVLALVTFMGLLVPAILGLVSLGPRITKPVLDDRRELYAASSAIDAAVELGRTQPDVGVPGGPCPTQNLTIDSLDVTVQCQQHAYPDDGCLYLDRFVNYTAEVRRPGDATVLARAASEVVYRFDLYALPKVEIRQWTPNAGGPVTTLPLPPCDPIDPPPPPPPPPLAALAAPVWEPDVAATTNGENGNNRRWRGEATILVTATTGTPVDAAEVVVTPYYQLTTNGPWIQAANLTGTTTSSGTNTFHSAYYRTNGNNTVPPHAVRVRFVVQQITTPGGLTWTADPLAPIAIEVAKP